MGKLHAEQSVKTGLNPDPLGYVEYYDESGLMAPEANKNYFVACDVYHFDEIAAQKPTNAVVNGKFKLFKWEDKYYCGPNSVLPVFIGFLG